MVQSKVIQKINFWLPTLFNTLGLLAAINSFIDMFLDEGVNPMTFYDAMLFTLTCKFFIDPKGIFFKV